jgi:phage host-nuclease inhibitor protein Gam
LADVQEERAVNARVLGEERARMENELKEMRDADAKTTSALREDCDKLLEEATRRHKVEMQNLHEQLAIEKESRESIFTHRQEATRAEKVQYRVQHNYYPATTHSTRTLQEEVIREKVRAERDRDIEMVISRLEEEATSAQSEMGREHEAKTQKVRDRLQAQLKDAEEQETEAHTSLRDVKVENTRLGSEIAALRADLEGSNRQRDSFQDKLSRLGLEREDMADIVRKEFEEQLAADERDIAALRKELAEARSRHRKEMTDIERAKDVELDNVNVRVRQIISSKEETIAELRKQFKAAAVRADHLETILENLRSAGKNRR